MHAMHRLRKTLVIRAYNNRPENTTLEQQFSFACKKNAKGISFITKRDIQTICNLDMKNIEAMDELLMRCRLSGDQIDYKVCGLGDDAKSSS